MRWFRQKFDGFTTVTYGSVFSPRDNSEHLTILDQGHVVIEGVIDSLWGLQERKFEECIK